MNNPLCHWSDIRVFLAVCRAGSTLAASRQLQMSQPTVARRIDALEHDTGLILFERDTRGLRPTEAAQTLLPMAEAMEAAAGDLSEAARGLRTLRPIRITAYSANFSDQIMQIYSDFAATYPGVDFEFLPGTRNFDLKAGEADVALRILRTPPDPDLICRKVSTAEFALFASRDYVAERGKPRSLDDLRGHDFVSFGRPEMRMTYHDWLSARVPDQIVGTFADANLTRAAIKSGRGLGIENVRLCAADPELVQCSDPIPDFTADHMILVSPAAWRRPEVKAFMKYFAPRYAARFR